MAYDVTTGLVDPANDGEVIDISAADHSCTQMTRAIYVGTSGAVKVDMRGGTALTFTNVQDGTVLPVRVSKVYQTGTTASNMVALW